MEGSGRGRKDWFLVERSFECSRLEKQLLSRAYELAVPVIGRTLRARSVAGGRGHQSQTHSGKMAKGA